MWVDGFAVAQNRTIAPGSLLAALARPACPLEVFTLDRQSITLAAPGGCLSTLHARQQGVALRCIEAGQLMLVSVSGAPQPVDLTSLIEVAPWVATPLRDFPAPIVDCPALDIFDASLALLSPECASEYLMQLLTALREDMPVGESLRITECAFNYGWETIGLANTAGADLSYQRTFAEVWLEVSLGSRKAPALGAAYVQRNRLAELDFAQIGRQTARLAQQAQHAQRAISGLASVVFGPQAVACLIEAVLLPACLNGARLPKLASHLKLRDDAHCSGGLNSAPFDDEGCPTAPRLLLTSDHHAQLIDCATAARLGVPPTGHGFRVASRQVRRQYWAAPVPAPTNVLLEGDTLPQEALLTGAKGGVWIPIVVGVHFAPAHNVSGMAFNAHRIRGGALAEPLAPFKFEIAADDVFGRMDAIGAQAEPIRPFPWWSPAVIVAPAARTEGLRIVQ